MTRFLVWLVAALAAGVLVWALPETIRFLPEAPDGFWAMALAALLVDVPLFGVSGREDFRIRSTLTVCFSFAIFGLWGAGPAIVVQALTGWVSAIGQRYHWQAGLFFVSRLICAAAVAALVVDFADPPPVTLQGMGLNGGDLAAFALLAAVWCAVNYGLLAAGRAMVRARELRPPPYEMRLVLVSTTSAVLVVAPLLTTIPGWWTLLIAVPVIVWNQLIRERLLQEGQLRREPVSGLLDRQGLAGGIRAITASDVVSPAGPRPFGIVLVDFESVIGINRIFGREIYEKVVGVAARRLVDAYGEKQAARLSGESVVILMADLTEADAVGATEAAVSLLEPLVEVDGVPFALEPAGGAALSPLHGRDVGSLLIKAELAASEARRTGQRAVLYVRQAAALAQRRLVLVRELRNVLLDPHRHHEVTVLYQPQVEISTGRLSGVEALLRWTHPEWGLVPTDELIEAIEPSVIMHLLTRHVLESVTAQVGRWNEQGEQLRVSVNVSVRELHDPGFVDKLGALVRKHGIELCQLIIEITERSLISDAQRVKEVARTAAEYGVGLSLDDFGTGYASLQQLRELPLTEVKVDQSYISRMIDNPADAAIVASVYQLTRTLNLGMVAEGVEDQHTVDALAALVGIVGQGWYFGRPMTVEDLEEWRQTRRRQ